MNRQEKKQEKKQRKELVSEINNKTENGEIIWKIGGKGKPPYDEAIGRSEFPFIAHCNGMDLMLYRKYDRCLKISKGGTSTTSSGGLYTLFKTVDRLVMEPILKERERRQQAEKRRKQAERKSLFDQLANALKKTK